MGNRSEMNRYLLYGLTLFLFLAALGCSGAGVPAGQDTLEPRASATNESGEYMLQEGDALDIKFYYNPELNELVTIRPDGRISLQLIGEVDAAGLSPSELRSVLIERYTGLLRNTEVAVIVKEFAAQKVYVGGEVNSPGIVPIYNGMTSLQAILRAGGWRNTAEHRSVVVIRGQGTEKPLFMNVNLGNELGPSAQHNDVMLQPYDVVFVPKTTIARMNQFVDQYIDKLIPISRSVGFSWIYNLNPEIQSR